MGHVWEDGAVAQPNQEKSQNRRNGISAGQKDDYSQKDENLSSKYNLPVRKLQGEDSGEETAQRHSHKVKGDHGSGHLGRQSHGFPQVSAAPDQTGGFQGADSRKNTAGGSYFFSFQHLGQGKNQRIFLFLLGGFDAFPNRQAEEG